MYEHMKGGRGKKAAYKTVVARIPEPLMPRVDSLIKAFHEEIVNQVNNCEESIDEKAVTTNNVVSLIGEIIENIEAEKPGYKQRYAAKLIEALLRLKQYL